MRTEAAAPALFIFPSTYRHFHTNHFHSKWLTTWRIFGRTKLDVEFTVSQQLCNDFANKLLELHWVRSWNFSVQSAPVGCTSPDDGPSTVIALSNLQMEDTETTTSRYFDYNTLQLLWAMLSTSQSKIATTTDQRREEEVGRRYERRGVRENIYKQGCGEEARVSGIRKWTPLTGNFRVSTVTKHFLVQHVNYV